MLYLVAEMTFQRGGRIGQMKSQAYRYAPDRAGLQGVLASYSADISDRAIHIRSILNERPQQSGP